MLVPTMLSTLISKTLVAPSQTMIVELIGRNGPWAAIDELQFLNSSGQVIQFVTNSVDAADSTRGGSVPTYWNNSIWGRRGINNGAVTQDSYNTCVFLYNGTSTDVARFRIEFTNASAAKTITQVRLYDSNAGTYRAKDINIYSLAEGGVFNKNTMVYVTSDPSLRKFAELKIAPSDPRNVWRNFTRL